jgi:hypothetical protein
MIQRIIAAVVVLSISPGAMAANCEKNPSHPSCGGEPVPNLTDRVEALETSNQDLTTRVESLEEAIGYMQPHSGKTLVLLDDTDQYVGTVYDGGTALIGFEGYSGAYYLVYNFIDKTLSPRGKTYFTDSTCGADLGDAYVQDTNVSNQLFSSTGYGREGELYLATVPGGGNAVGVDTSFRSRIQADGTCYAIEGHTDLVPAVMVSFSITPPIKYGFR